MILVTGANGQLGSDVCAELDRTGTPHLGIDIDTLDLTDGAAVQRFFAAHPDIEAVIHCAAYTAVDKAEDDAVCCEKVNVQATKHLAEACGSEKKMLYISSDYVFGSNDPVWLETDSPKHPQGVYAKTKLAGEEAVGAICKKYFIVRTSWVFGEKNTNFIATMLRLAKTHDMLRVVNDQVGAPTYAKHLAVLLCEMIQTDRFGVFHATNEGLCSWAELARFVFEQANRQVTVIPVTTEEYAARAPRPLNSRLSKRSLDENGFSRLPKWEDAVREYLAGQDKKSEA